jgi:hypothetical protein
MANERLLSQAKAAGDRLAEAERQVVAARADYHTAIRRLHLAGAPLREIARALDLSHQRVQQVVSAAGGSWWQLWRRRATERDLVCTWCDRPDAEVAKLIAGPNVFICDTCVDAAERVLQGAHVSSPTLGLGESGSRHRCDFCRKKANDRRSLVLGAANVCSECLRTCREILNSRAA